MQMAKLESEDNSLTVECVKKDASEMEFIIKVKSYGIEASFPLVATVENFEKFLGKGMGSGLVKTHNF
jgi:hypothetical protein